MGYRRIAADALSLQVSCLIVSIVSVRAIDTTFGFGGDEVFLLATNGQRFPASSNAAQDIDAGEVWSPSVAFPTVRGQSIDLREYDSVSASDLIGNFSVSDTQAPGGYTSTPRAATVPSTR